MRKIILFAFFSFCIIQSQAQDKKLSEAAIQAGKQNKMLMLVVRSEECSQCNSVAEEGIKAAKNSIDSNCVVLMQNQIPTEIDFGKGLFLVPKDFFGALFFDKELNILGFQSGSSSLGYFYVQAIQKALSQSRNQDQGFKAVKQEYYTNIGSFSAIQKLINSIRELGLEPASSLIDELVQNAPADSANSTSFLQFILKSAPVVGSSSRVYVDKSRENFNVAWYRMSLRERQNINQRINYKSMQKAIAEKNIGYANQVAYFVQGTYSDNIEDGQKANGRAMLQYYKGINDTVNYLRSVFNFYDRFYMNVKPETIKLEDSINLKKMMANSTNQPIPPEVLRQIPDSLHSKIASTRSVVFSPRAQSYAQSLNEGAWLVYKFTKNSTQLSRALMYSKRALEFFESPDVADTYARLLYRTGNKEEAIIWETKAITGRQKQRMPATEFEKVLQLMKKDAVEIDN